MRYRALVEYDGTAYYGFQRQRAGQKTIQGELERGLAVLAKGPVTIVGAGRTDSGVHASGQTVSFKLDWSHGPDALARAWNANLPADIAVRALSSAPAEFHPRFDALRRTYKYYVYNQTTRSPLRRRYSWHVRQPLDLDRLNAAAALLIGRHDFATFGQPPQGKRTVREVYEAAWTEEGPFLVFLVEANAFLYRMVRSLVGTMKQVGEGAWSVAQFETALAAADRQRAGKTAPAHGLTLVSVTYKEWRVEDEDIRHQTS